ncbi:MAG: helix-turn-helix domain-containing protein [Leifsonia sp.]
MLPEPWVDSEAAAAHLGKSVFTIRRWAQTAAIPARKVGREWMFQLSAIDAHLNRVEDPWIQSPRSRGRRRI